MTANPNGAIALTDGGTPRVITVKARANISGGYWVVGSSSHGAVGSGADSYAASDFEGVTNSNLYCSGAIGVALQDIGSNTYGPVATRGIFLMPVGSATLAPSIIVGAGDKVVACNEGGVLPYTSGTLLAYTKDWTVGKSLSTGSGDSYVAVSLNI